MSMSPRIHSCPRWGLLSSGHWWIHATFKTTSCFSEYPWLSIDQCMYIFRNRNKKLSGCRWQTCAMAQSFCVPSKIIKNTKCNRWESNQGNYTIQSGTHDFLLTFHSNHRPISQRFRDKRQYPSKIANFSHPRVLNASDEGVPLGIWYRRKGSRMLLWRCYQMVEKF